MRPNTLSKSRFKVALECRRKLTYLSDSDSTYANDRTNNEFLEALALGGHQIGTLAKLMHPQGIEIADLKLDEQIAHTERELQKDSVILFEPTFQAGNLVVRVDVLIKRGTQVDLLEVKSKCFNPLNPEHSFRGSRGAFRAEWLPYLQDVAFQTHVLQLCKPSWRITPHLMLVDPTALCDIDALGTRIRAEADGRSTRVHVDPTLQVASLPQPLIVPRDVTVEVQDILAGNVELPDGNTLPFLYFVSETSEQLAAGIDAAPTPGSQCKRCEFYCDPEQRSAEVRSGWAECMEQRLGRPIAVSRTDTIFGLSNDRSTAKRLAAGQLLLADQTDDDVEQEDKPGVILPAHRRRLQVEEVRDGEDDVFLREETLREAFASWQWPLHFIDFETSRPLLPFHAGRRPNQQLLFQYSHHVLQQDGHLEHRSQSLVTDPGVLPNAQVVRALASALGGDNGTVIHWWTHERSVLEDIQEQIATSAEPDRQQLVAFINSLLRPATGPGARLVDMGLPLVSKKAFFPGTNGRSSIKKVLPAVLHKSAYLQARYGQPVYGTAQMPSLNFPAGWQWIQREGNGITDPYKLLGQFLLDLETDAIAAEAESEEDRSDGFIANGGAAMIAYADLQRRDLPAHDRTGQMAQLLRYCELDSLAMVMVYEALHDWVS